MILRKWEMCALEHLNTTSNYIDDFALALFRYVSYMLSSIYNRVLGIIKKDKNTLYMDIVKRQRRDNEQFS